jgi:hypothetical protein
MLNRCSKIITIASWLALGTSASAQSTGPGIIVAQPVGQATGSTCQSYVLALALAFKRDKAFALKTTQELRTAEMEIRSLIVAEFKKDHPAATVPKPTHKHVASGFAAFAKGKYKLVIRDVDLPALSDAAGIRTGITGEGSVPPSFLLGDIVKDVIISSATKIGKDPYKEGHLFTILGISGPPNSQRRFLILNSAVKGQNSSQNACSDGVPDEPGHYTASVSWWGQTDVDFKLFGNKVKSFTVEPGP